MDTKDIAVVLGMDESVVINTIQDMEQEQIICGYNTIINWDKTDDERVTALIEVKVAPQRGEGFERVAERIYNYEEVTSLYLMSGGFDMTVFIEGKTMKEVAQFVARKLAPMEGVLSTSTHFVLKKYKEKVVLLFDRANHPYLKTILQYRLLLPLPIVKEFQIFLFYPHE